MIETLAPGQYRDTLSLTDFLVGDDLAWVGQAFTLRVTGWSMFPTLRKGDALRLLPADTVEAGDLVLFRQDRTLVCHRVMAAPPGEVVLTRGDAVPGDGELVQRANLVGKVAEILRRDESIDPRRPRTATVGARIGRLLQRTATALRGRPVEALSRVLQIFFRNTLVRPAAGLLLRRYLSYAVGVPAPLRLVRAYRFVELGRRPIDPGRAMAAIRSLPSVRDAILLARLGTVPLGTLSASSGEMQVRQAGAGLGVEETLLEMMGELRSLESALGD